MKKVYNISFVFLFVLCAILSCTEEYDFTEIASTDDEQASLIVQEAKEFFANSYSAYTRSGGKEFSGYYLNPGDVTPMWENSIISKDAERVNVDVPIISQKRFRIMRSEIRNGQAQAYNAAVTQRIVVSKNVNSGKMSQYLMTFIPDKKFMVKNKGSVKANVTSLQKNYFSGMIIYSVYQINYPFKVEKYEDGNKVCSINMPIEVGLVGSKFEKIFGSMKVGKSYVVQTRSEGFEDFWDWFEDEVFDEADDGDSFIVDNDDEDWWLEDQDGNRYDVPDDFIEEDNENTEEEGNEPAFDEGFGDQTGDSTEPKSINFYHVICGTYLGTVYPSSKPGTKTFYCNTCREYVTVEY